MTWGAAPPGERVAGPGATGHDDAARGRHLPRARDQGPRGPPHHRAHRDRRRRLEGGAPGRGGRGLRHEAVPLPGAAGADQPRAAAPGRPVAGPANRAGAGTRARARAACGDRQRGERLAHPDRIAPPLRPRREPGPDGPDRDARGPRLGRHGRRRFLLRLGHDAAPPPEDRAGREPAAPPGHRPRDRLPPGGGLDVIPFRIRITAALLIAALVPLAAFGALLVITGRADSDGSIFRILLTAFVIAALLGIGIAFVVADSLTAPLRALATALDRIAAGDTSTPLPALADDELGRLAERQNQLAADLLRRNRQVARVVDAVGTYSPREGADRLVDLAIADARTAFGLIDARIVLGDPSDIPVEERVPGDPLPIRADLRAGAEPLGALVGLSLI